MHGSRFSASCPAAGELGGVRGLLGYLPLSLALPVLGAAALGLAGPFGRLQAGLAPRRQGWPRWRRRLLLGVPRLARLGGGSRYPPGSSSATAGPFGALLGIAVVGQLTPTASQNWRRPWRPTSLRVMLPPVFCGRR